MSITELGEGQLLQKLTLVEPVRYEEEFPVVKLTREQADMVVRQFTDRYYQYHGEDNGPRLDTFVHWLSWVTGGNFTKGYIEDVLSAWNNAGRVYAGDLPNWTRRDVDELLNVSVDDALDAARFDGARNRGERFLGGAA